MLGLQLLSFLSYRGKPNRRERGKIIPPPPQPTQIKVDADVHILIFRAFKEMERAELF